MTKEFDERNMAKSRKVCDAMEAAHVTQWRKLTERERQILDMWPRFEDGEPVMIGDEVDGLGGEIIEVYIAENAAAIWNNFASHMHLEPGERVKRPAPEVLDADGVLIKADDTVWHEDGSELHVIGFGDVQDGETMLVVKYAAGPTKWGEVRCLSVTHTRPAPKVLDADGVRILKGELLYGVGRSGHLFSVLDPCHIDPELGSAFSVRCIDLTEAEECHCKPELLAHSPEVLDADGAPIKVGDTVYEPNGQSGIVTAVHPSSRCVDLRQDGCDAYAMDTKRLTHTRPDSWKRIVEDMKKSPCAYFGFLYKDCDEGDGCPADEPVDCRKVMTIDIIRRAKALAGAEAD